MPQSVHTKQVGGGVYPSYCVAALKNIETCVFLIKERLIILIGHLSNIVLGESGAVITVMEP